MKALIVFCSLCVMTLAESNEECSAYDPCKNSSITGEEPKYDSFVCSAMYGNILSLQDGLSDYATVHLAKSFEYLLLSANFGGFYKNRKGFEKLFRQLSDSTWEDGIDLVKYVSKRGGVVNFDIKLSKTASEQHTVNLNEFVGLAHALDTHKHLATKAFNLHHQASKENPDPEVASYLENKFLGSQAETIRDLAGHTHDVKQMISYPELRSLSLFLFDEYLQKHI